MLLTAFMSIAFLSNWHYFINFKKLSKNCKIYFILDDIEIELNVNRYNNNSIYLILRQI